MTFKVPRYGINNVRILPCENRKIDKNHLLFFIDSIAPLRIQYKMPGIASKSHKLVIKYSLANSVYGRIYVRKSSGQ